MRPPSLPAASPIAPRLALAAVESAVLVTTVPGSWWLFSGTSTLPESWLTGTPFTTWSLPALLLLLAVGVPAGVAAALELLDHGAAPTASLVHGLALVLFIAVQLVLLERYTVFQPLSLLAATAVLAIGAHRGTDTR